MAGQNKYEQAVEAWLIDNQIKFVKVDQAKRSYFARSKVKSFDFMVYCDNGKLLLVEVKGRRFKGESLAGLGGLQNWVTLEDVSGMLKWEEVMGECSRAVFVFAYEFDNVDVERDGIDVFSFDNREYVFFMAAVGDYCQHMRSRSIKWNTVSLSAKDFREILTPIGSLLVQ